MAGSDFIKNIIAKKTERLNILKSSVPLDDLKARMGQAGLVRSFKQAISKPKTLSVIAEFKKASPSAGIIRDPYIIEDIAKAYTQAQVNAVSVLTEEDFFQGDIGHLNQVRALINVPILRKDFIIDPYQVYESRLSGADALLLIAAILTKEKLAECLGIAKELGLDAVVEVHDEKELKKVLTLKPDIIGINNRNLKTMEVDLKTTERLYTLIPPGKIVIVESGIKSRQDCLFLKILGINAVLIGEAFMRAQDIASKVDEIIG